MKLFFLKFLSAILFFVVSFEIKAQDERAQLPLVLQNAYFGVSVGSINYDFSASQFMRRAMTLRAVFVCVADRIKVPKDAHSC